MQKYLHMNTSINNSSYFYKGKQMKKLFIATALVVASFNASAANFVQVEQENVINKGATGNNSAVTYLRAGKDLGDFNLGLQSRTARFETTNSIANSLEATMSNKNVSMFGITPFVGVGHDFGNVSKAFNYGLVGATTGAKVGPGYAMLGLKSRVFRENSTDPKQTVGFVSYALPLKKDVAVDIGMSRSYQTIKENGISVGLRLGF